MIKYASDKQEAHKPMGLWACRPVGLWACEPVSLTKTLTYPKIPDPPIVAAGLLGPDLVLSAMNFLFYDVIAILELLPNTQNRIS